MKPVGFRFRPTDKELLHHYLRVKNLGGSSTNEVDRVISTVDICSFDPWKLPLQSKIKSSDPVWYFFGRKKNKYNRGDRQSRTNDFGKWKKTGKCMDIMRNGKKIGEKWVLVFVSSDQTGSKSDWVLHEYHASNHMMPYTICKLKYKGEIEHLNKLLYEGSCSFDEIDGAFNNALSDKWIGLLDDDDNDYEQTKIVPMQEDRNNYKPQKPLTGVCDGYVSDDDNASDAISATTTTTISSIETSNTCDSFGSSNHHRRDFQESPNLSQNVSQKLGQETLKKKKTGFFYKIIKRFVKRIQL